MTTRMTRVEAEFPAAYGGDGYDFIDAARSKGWTLIPNWGSDGWDAGAWPYVIFMARRSFESAEVLTYVEGDITITEHRLLADAYADLDRQIHWYWSNGQSDGPSDFDASNPDPDHCGPFSWHRQCIKTGAPQCGECRALGEVVT